MKRRQRLLTIMGAWLLIAIIQAIAAATR